MGDEEGAGSVTWAAPPSQQYSQAAQKAGSGAAVPIEQAGKIHIVTEDGKTAMGLKPAEFTKWADERLNCGNPKIEAQTQKFLDANGIVKTTNGNYLVQMQPEQAAMQAAFPGNTTKNPVSSGILGTLQNSSWLLPTMGFATGGVGGLVMGLLGAKALKASAGAMTGDMGSLAPALLGAGGSGASYMGTIGGSASWGSAATVMGVMGLDGMAYNMKKQMASYAQEAKMDSLIAMTNNPGIPIEDLIAMFMAQMADTYDQKLRMKMEETARAEKREQERTREKEAGDFKAGMVSGIGSALSMIPVVGTAAAVAGQVAGNVIRQTTDAKIALKDALQGNTKSSTILMQEIQILMNKWKQMNELLSNLSKTLHDMAMTPIRNLR
jgi:hypothetical protein